MELECHCHFGNHEITNERRRFHTISRVDNEVSKCQCNIMKCHESHDIRTWWLTLWVLMTACWRKIHNAFQLIQRMRQCLQNRRDFTLLFSSCQKHSQYCTLEHAEQEWVQPRAHPRQALSQLQTHSLMFRVIQLYNFCRGVRLYDSLRSEIQTFDGSLCNEITFSRIANLSCHATKDSPVCCEQTMSRQDTPFANLTLGVNVRRNGFTSPRASRTRVQALAQLSQIMKSIS